MECAHLGYEEVLPTKICSALGATLMAKKMMLSRIAHWVTLVAHWTIPAWTYRAVETCNGMRRYQVTSTLKQHDTLEARRGNRLRLEDQRTCLGRR